MESLMPLVPKVLEGTFHYHWRQQLNPCQSWLPSSNPIHIESEGTNRRGAPMNLLDGPASITFACVPILKFQRRPGYMLIYWSFFLVINLWFIQLLWLYWIHSSNMIVCIVQVFFYGSSHYLSYFANIDILEFTEILLGLCGRGCWTRRSPSLQKQ